jgi:hypothetical protein
MTDVPAKTLGGKDFWHRRNSYEMLAELAEVSPEEYGYLTILRDLMFVQGGAIADDPRIAKRYLGCNIQRWLPLRESFIQRGKIYQNGNTLRSQLVDEPLENTRERRKKVATISPEIPAKSLKSNDPKPHNTIQHLRRKLVADLFLDGPLDDAALQVGKGRKRRNLQRPSGHFLYSN